MRVSMSGCFSRNPCKRGTSHLTAKPGVELMTSVLSCAELSRGWSRELFHHNPCSLGRASGSSVADPPRDSSTRAHRLLGMNRLAGCRSVQDIVSVQSEIVRDGLEETVKSSRRIAEVSIRVAD